MSATIIKGVTINCPIETSNETARRNVDTIIDFFSVYLKDKPFFYSLWVEDAPEVITPFVTGDVAVCQYASHSGWEAVRAFWDPIHDEMEGRFDWFVDEIIIGENPDVIVTKANSIIDVQTGPTWGSRHVSYNGRYVQIFKFENGKVKSFEEYYDTALLNKAYQA